jgi:hypothetical protein
MTIQRAAQTALDVQDACNLSGVLRAWVDAQHAVFETVNNTTDRNQHPIAVLFANKCASLTNQHCGDAADTFGKAYDACMRLAREDA